MYTRYLYGSSEMVETADLLKSIQTWKVGCSVFTKVHHLTTYNYEGWGLKVT